MPLLRPPVRVEGGGDGGLGALGACRRDGCLDERRALRLRVPKQQLDRGEGRRSVHRSLGGAWAATPKTLQRLAEFPRLEGLWIGDGGRRNQPAITALRRLRVLRLNGATGADLGFLGGLTDLHILELSSVTAASLRGIERLRRLECLVIDHAASAASV